MTPTSGVGPGGGKGGEGSFALCITGFVFTIIFLGGSSFCFTGSGGMKTSGDGSLTGKISIGTSVGLKGPPVSGGEVSNTVGGVGVFSLSLEGVLPLNLGIFTFS